MNDPALSAVANPDLADPHGVERTEVLFQIAQYFGVAKSGRRNQAQRSVLENGRSPVSVVLLEPIHGGE